MSQETKNNEPVYVVDGYGLIFRAYFAFIRTPIRSPEGKNTSAIFGFFRVLLSFIKKYRPHYLALALDSRTPTFRDELYPDYKATRQSTPEELKEQFPLIEKICAELGLPMLRVDGFEADDLMASLAAGCKSRGNPCVILSADKDMLQLVEPGIGVLKPSKDGGFESMDEAKVFEEKGVRPDQILDYLSLLGDTADNIPGVKGIGEKSAVKLLADYGSLDGIYAALPGMKPSSQKDKLEQGKESAYFSRTLIELRRDVDLGLTGDDPWKSLEVKGFNGVAASEELKKYGIKQLAAEIAQLGIGSGDRAGAPAEAQAHPGSAGGGEPFAAAGEEPAGAVPFPSPAGTPGAQAGEAPEPAGELEGTEAALPVEGPGAPDIAGTKPGEYDPAYHRFELVTTIEGVRRWVEKAKAGGVYALDTETDGLDPRSSALCGVSLSCGEGSGCYIAVKGPGGPVLAWDEVRPILAELTENPAYRLVGQNIKFDLLVLKAKGLAMKNPWFDTMVAAWLVESNHANYGMDDLSLHYLNYRPISFDSLFDEELMARDRAEREEERNSRAPSGSEPLGEAEGDDFALEAGDGGAAKASKKKDYRFSRVGLERAAVYSAEDSEVTFRLYKALEPELRRLELEKLFFTVEMPLLPLLAEMEWQGMHLKADSLKIYSAELALRLKQIEEEIYRLVGHPFNIGSTKQLQEILFVERKLKGTKRTKTGWSTDTSVLEELAPEDPVPQKILEYRGLAKLKSTYVDTLPLLIHPDTGRIHTSFIQTGTATGRVASKDPNMQNIPIKDEDGRRIREAFVPGAGCCFVSADYSQIELVVLAHLADEQGLISAFENGIDVHRATGSLIFGVKPEDVSPEQRRVAKTINFGVMYGMSAFRLSRELGIPQKQAHAFIDAYFATYAGIKGFIQKTIAQAERDGGVRTMLGRFRSIPAIRSSNRNEKQAAERVAVNSPIQGSAADIVKLAMLALDKKLREEGLVSRLVLQVHDELILEVPLEEKERVMELTAKVMTQAIALKVPLKVSVEAGASWGAMH